VLCDASSIAMGVCLEIDDKIVEDAAWLRKEDDGAHINVAELEAVLKGVSLALKWQIKDMVLMTDSATVFSWVKSVLDDTRRPKVSGLSEMLVRRRLWLLRELVDEYGIAISMEFVPSEKNRADILTRVPQAWLRRICVGVEQKCGVEELWLVHKEHHFGIERTHYLAEKRFGCKVNRRDVENIVQSCQQCKSIDPHPVTWKHGKLSVDGVWQRLAANITFVEGRPYLSVIHCGPSRFAIWQRLQNQTASAVTQSLERIFLERGPPEELLSDNGPCFNSSVTKTLFDKWGISHINSAAYCHSGNGIVERNHRTIKR